VLVDFDGTACSHDVAEHLLIAFGDPSWPEYDEAVDRGELPLREAILIQNRLLHADHDTMLAYALEHCPLDPTFASFCGWLADRDIPVAVVSDGFGFYIEPLMEAAGLGHLTVLANEQLWDAGGMPAGVTFAHAHPECVGCGTCKMRAVTMYREAHGPVAFIGEGQSDRYGALYADVVFAKDALPGYCEADGVPYLPWEDFGDVRATLEAIEAAPGPVAPLVCPGWTTPD
jgi:2-hydroxy-3-keto-5-methylthiopentenyl-1-phosphate phosphatase